MSFSLIWNWFVLILFASGIMWFGYDLWRIYRKRNELTSMERAVRKLRIENRCLWLWLLILMLAWRIERLMEL